jgi:hypothetical protein
MQHRRMYVLNAVPRNTLNLVSSRMYLHIPPLRFLMNAMETAHVTSSRIALLVSHNNNYNLEALQKQSRARLH